MSIYRRRLSPLKPNQVIDYQDVELLRTFITEQGKILPRRVTGLTAKQQRAVTKAIKQARVLALLPFVNREN
uniref:Small ribosomal subunit protein bS18c n=1 Tax=Cyanophora biloba TaxID=1489483 RepID=A0A2Z4HGL0_9EUKA|nr:ribosomal protein S18 [Cyanophora biloba]AWW13872.1 ribosomal protein S18 [Cyanophora biloba]